jgi:hypothetical protein
MIQDEMGEDIIELWGSGGGQVLGCQNKAIGIAIKGQNAAGKFTEHDELSCFVPVRGAPIIKYDDFQGEGKVLFMGTHARRAQHGAVPVEYLPIVMVTCGAIVSATPRLHSLDLRPEPHGQGSFLPSISDSSLSPCTMRKPTLDVSYRWELFAAFAAGRVEKSCCSRQSLLPDGFAHHIRKANRFVLRTLLLGFGGRCSRKGYSYAIRNSLGLY